MHYSSTDVMPLQALFDMQKVSYLENCFFKAQTLISEWKFCASH